MTLSLTGACSDVWGKCVGVKQSLCVQVWWTLSSPYVTWLLGSSFCSHPCSSCSLLDFMLRHTEPRCGPATYGIPVPDSWDSSLNSSLLCRTCLWRYFTSSAQWDLWALFGLSLSMVRKFSTGREGESCCIFSVPLLSGIVKLWSCSPKIVVLSSA